MSKYEPLRQHLQAFGGGEWQATFADLEALLGFTLPNSARTYSAWWANSAQGSSAAKTWLDAGWRVDEVQLADQTVVFQRAGIQVPPPPSVPQIDLSSAEPMACRVRVAWKELGLAKLDAEGRLAFPKVRTEPAIYRFTIQMEGKTSRYVGEAVNLARRCGNYRNPGSTQETSKRLNAELLAALRCGAVVTVAAILTGGAWIDLGAGEQPADLLSKVTRCLIENAAILGCGGIDIEMLNRAD